MKKTLLLTLSLCATLYTTTFSSELAFAQTVKTDSAITVSPDNSNEQQVTLPVEKPKPEPKPKPVNKMKKAIQIAMDQRGIPYVFGGKSTAGFDCSGLIDYSLKNAGIKPGYTNAEGYYAMGKHVTKPQVGDLVFFSNTYRQGISHIGIYIGHDKMINASGDKVQVNQIHGPFWKDHFTGYKRLTNA